MNNFKVNYNLETQMLETLDVKVISNELVQAIELYDLRMVNGEYKFFESAPERDDLKKIYTIVKKIISSP